ncbi:MAG: ABC transporter permease [Chitinophagaceae bacterium]|nr:ABC transporter permease [Chitinophagaceae bacterium]
MIKNYFKIAVRNLVRHKGYMAINVGGLAVGIASCLLLFLVVNYELSYDKFQPQFKNIYRVVTQDKFSDGITYNAGIPVAALPALRVQYPNVLFGAINSNYGGQVTIFSPGDASANKKYIEQTGLFFCEPDVFKFLNYKWLSGNGAVLSEPNSAVFAKSTAEKYFGTWQDAVGKSILLDNKIPVKVSAIMEDVPSNSDFPFRILVSFETLKQNAAAYTFTDNWNSTSSNFQIFALLPSNLSPANFNQQLLAFSKEHYSGRTNSVKTNFLQPLSTLHFDKRFEIFGNHITSMSTLWTLSLIGILIIIMACINFINLATAQAVSRSKEVGIRKVLGSKRGQLFFQVMGETGLVVFISALLALGIAAICLPYIKHIASIEEKLVLLNPTTIIFLLVIGFIVTLFSGFYPSLMLSGFNPALALKNKISSAKVGGISLRRGLVVMQFAISQVLIIGTIVAITQMSFISHADLGFNKEAVLVLAGSSDSAVIARLPSFKEKLLQIPGVQNASYSSDVPSSDNTWGTNFGYDHQEGEKYEVTLKFADEDYFKTYDLKLLAGRIFGKSDTINEVLINETLAQKLETKNATAVIGKEIRLGASPWKKIVGVVKDFKTNSLRENVKPLLIGERNKYYSNTSIKIRTSDIPKTQAAIQSAWNQFFPEYAYSASFMDENIAKFYEQENHLSLLYKIFAGLAIFISCLGLYGLVSFMAVQRTKEIGVRKVLGASVGNIVYLFSREFTILIVVAFLIAAPVAYYMMSNWLSDFVYRVKLGAAVFLLAILISVIIAWVTVGYKAIRAAVANPVKSLRSE